MIVGMKKVFILGTQENKDKVLNILQQAGVVHVEPANMQKFPAIPHQEEDLERAQHTIFILETYQKKGIVPKDRKPLNIPLAEMPVEVEKMAKKLKELKAYLNEQKRELKVTSLWGEFSSKRLDEMEKQGVKFRFWKCPVQEADQFSAETIPWKKLDGNILCLVTVSYKDNVVAPKNAEEIIIENGTEELKQTISSLEKEICELERTFSEYSDYIPELRKHSIYLSNAILFSKVQQTSLTQGEIFGLKGWVPLDCLDKVKEVIKELPVAVEFRDPTPEEEPPTLMKNPKWIQSVVDVVKVYATPGYKEWDSCTPTYFAFTVFFSMIIGDGGYGLILLLSTLYLRKKMLQSDLGTRIYRLMLTLSFGCILFGFLTCTWFSIALDTIKQSPVNFLTVVQEKWLPTDPDAAMWAMMNLAIYMGATHLCVARMIQICRLWGSTLWIAELAWIVAIWAGVAKIIWHVDAALNVLFVCLGIVFIFGSNSRHPIRRIAEGLLAVTGISQNFADILSYLRLFALALAGTMLGQVFNNIGYNIHATMPGIIGLILTIIVLFIGHTINFVLCIMGGIIHGLRLNFLEFYRYCFEGTGYDYKPFVKTGV